MTRLARPGGSPPTPRSVDVARLAGVSQKTVSRVLNDEPYVSADVRRRVLDAAEELGYRRNQAARALASGRTRSIGVVTLGTALYGPASLLSALSVAFVFLASARCTTTRGAMLVALGYGAGTGVWSTASQTLWQTDVVLATIGAAIAIMAARATHTAASVATCAMLLGIAVAVRPPTVVLAAALGIGLVAGARTRHIWLAAVGLVPVAATIWLNVHWFGNPLGGAPALEALHGTLHGVQGSVTKTPWQGAAGLLISPSRGLLVYSPVVLVAVTSLPVIWHAGWRDLRRWCAVGALLQFAAYACYSVWWGGHTFGPRYLLDILPALAPLAATGLSAWTGTLLRRGLVAVALAWSIAVAATGAFCYPADRWNTTPTDVDRAHRRLWQVRDPQILRCWRTGLSPQNFSFLETREWRSR